MPRSQRRNEAMQFAVQRHLLENLSAIGFERGSEVVNIDAAQLRHQPVGTPGREAAQPEIVNTHFAPAADDVITLGNLLQKNRNVGGIVLQVAIHSDDVFATRMIEPGCESGGLAEIPAKAHYRHAAVHACNLAE